MTAEIQDCTLSESQAACLLALRHGQDTNTHIAVQAKLDLLKTKAALAALKRLGLARRDQLRRWYTTARGKVCRFNTTPHRQRRNSGLPGPAGQRLLGLLDRPMQGFELAKELGVSHQRVRGLIIALHAKGLVSFGDLDNPFWMVMRVGDKTPVLSRDEERVLSVIPQDYVTTATRIRRAVGMPQSKVRLILERLMVRGLAEALDGLQGGEVYRITAAGLDHPQFHRSARSAEAPRLPVESDRVHQVLSAILDAGAMRIKDLGDVLGIPRQSMNALAQYLKRKRLVKKTDLTLTAPYTLTEEGCAALAEMTRRRAA